MGADGVAREERKRIPGTSGHVPGIRFRFARATAFARRGGAGYDTTSRLLRLRWSVTRLQSLSDACARFADTGDAGTIAGQLRVLAEQITGADGFPHELQQQP